VVKVLQGEVSAFHRRSLPDGYRFIYLDGLWLKVTSPVKARRVLLVAYGVKHGGNRELIDFMLATSESETCWWGFLSDLKARGLEGRPLEVIIHDGSGGLVKALKGLYPRVQTQLCIFHKLSNISQNLIDRKPRSQILKDAAAIYQAETEKELREELKYFRSRWRAKEPKAVTSFLRGFEETLTYLEYAEPLRSSIKTNNPLERYLEELQRRIKPFRKFASVGSVDRIVYGLVAYVLETREPNNLLILHN
jgi:transposase-like protein